MQRLFPLILAAAVVAVSAIAPASPIFVQRPGHPPPLRPTIAIGGTHIALVRSGAGTVSAETDRGGNAVFRNLAPGQYAVQVFEILPGQDALKAAGGDRPGTVSASVTVAVTGQRPVTVDLSRRYGSSASGDRMDSQSSPAIFDRWGNLLVVAKVAVTTHLQLLTVTVRENGFVGDPIRGKTPPGVVSLAGVAVGLYDTRGRMVARAVTDQRSVARFAAVRPGRYVVRYFGTIAFMVRATISVGGSQPWTTTSLKPGTAEIPITIGGRMPAPVQIALSATGR